MGTKKIGCVIAYRKGTHELWNFIGWICTNKKIQKLGYDVEVINYVKRPTLIQKWHG